MARWLKYGIVGLTVGAIFSFISTVLMNIINEFWGVPLIIITGPVLFVGCQLGFLIDYIFNTGKGYESLGYFILILFGIYYFLIGATVGFIVAKIKSKRIK